MSHLSGLILALSLFFVTSVESKSVCSPRITLPDDYYIGELPPGPEDGVPLGINVSLGIFYLDRVDDDALSYTVYFGIYFDWRELRLADEKANKTCKGIVLGRDSIDKIWKPDIYVFDGKASIPKVYEDMMYLKLDPFTGDLLWFIKVTMVGYCSMDFYRYPLDEQNCVLSMSSTAHSSEDIVFNLVSVRDFTKEKGDAHQYIHEIAAEADDKFGKSRFGFSLRLRRKIFPFLLKSYLPTCLLVMISWISFFIPCQMVPGRVALLVTGFLMIINISNGSRNEAPISAGFTAMDIWLVSCVVFQAAALCEYAVLLKIRFRGNQANSKEAGKKVFVVRSAKEESPVVDDLDRRCAKIDWASFWILLVLWTLYNVGYWSHYLTEE